MSIHWYNLFCNHISFKHSSSIIFLNFGLANALVFQFGNMPSFCQLPYTVSSIVFLFIYLLQIRKKVQEKVHTVVFY